MMIAVAMVASPTPARAAATTFVVNRIGDASDLNPGDAKCDTSANTGKQCTLRAAIQEANANSGLDTIHFNIKSASKVIAPNSPLPPITDRIIIDGYSQSGTSANTLAVGDNAVLKIVLDGVNTSGVFTMGLQVQTFDSIIKGLVIQRFNAGIYLTDTGPTDFNSNIIRGNFIGTNAAGTQARPNDYGVWVARPRASIGGFDAAARNVISGNALVGIYVAADVEGTAIKGNYLGTNAAGTGALGNAHGVVIRGGTGGVVGGPTAAERNVISANSQAGITLDGNNDVGTNTVQGNYIGTKANGTGDLGNGYGISIVGNDKNTIGGTTAGTANLIAGNDLSGIQLISTASGNMIQGNFIKANGENGILALSGPNTIGGGNQIYSNGLDGIRIQSPGSGINVTGNQIFGNGGLGINLVGGTEDAFGTTANDNDDPDPGANHLQNYPVLGSVLRSTSGQLTVVPGTVNSRPSTTYRIDIYVAVVDASGHGEGQILRDSQVITTNSGGDKSFSFNISAILAGQVVTATATAVTAGETSEFSINRTVIAVP